MTDTPFYKITVPVSYTHLDVSKRQAEHLMQRRFRYLLSHILHLPSLAIFHLSLIHICYHSASYVASITSNPIFLRNLKNRHKPFIHHYDFLPHPSIDAPIFFQEKLIGFLTIIGHYMDLTQGMLDFAGILVELLSRAMGYSGVTPYRNSPEDNILLRLIKGEGYDAQIDAVFLEKAGVTPDNLYYIAPVSYTHLDVYKRPLLWLANAAFKYSRYCLINSLRHHSISKYT